VQLGNSIKLDKEADDTKREFTINTIAAYIEMVSVLGKLVRQKIRTKVTIEEIGDEKTSGLLERANTKD